MRLFLVFTIIILVSCNNKRDTKTPVKNNNDRALEFNDLAIEADEKGETERAEKLYRWVLHYDDVPAENRIIFLRNFANHFTGDDYQPDSCRKYFQLALALCEENTFYYHMTRADLALLDNDAVAALPDLMLAERLDSSSHVLNNLLGQVFMGVYDEDFTDYPKAIRYNKRAYNGRTDVNTVFFYIKNLYMLDRNDEAESLFEEFKDVYVDEDIYYYGSLIKFESNKMDEGVELRKKVLEMDSSYYDNYVNYIDWWEENKEGKLPALPDRP